MSREIARIDLPVSTYTEIYWKIDLRNLFHFLKLRLDPHAQEEIRNYAFVIACITKELFPVAFEAFLDYELNSLKFSGPELKHLYDRTSISFGIYATLPEYCDLTQREIDEFEAKLNTPLKYSLDQFNINLLENYKPDTSPDPV